MLILRTMGFTLTVAVLLAAVSTARGGILLSHYGGTDPATENWVPVIDGSGTVGLVPNDVGPGQDAWHTTDTDTGAGSSYYTGTLSAEDLTYISQNSWAMRASLRVDDFAVSGFDETPALAPGIQLAFEEQRSWILFSLGSDTSGDTILSVKGNYNSTTGTWGPTITHTVAGNGYNDYELIWNPSDGLDVLVNDVSVADNYDCRVNKAWATVLGNRLQWGAMDTGGVGAGYWSSVEFESIEFTPPPFAGLYHSGGNDPATEGWTPVVDDPGNVGIEPNDVGPGADAWRTTDTLTTSSSAYYNGADALNFHDLQDLATHGWTMKASLRVDDFVESTFDETPGLAPGMQIAFEDPGIWLLLSLGSDANGDTSMQLKGGYYDGVWTPSENHTIAGSGYNDYELVWDPTDGLDVYVNDALIVDNFDCATDEAWAAILGDRLYWGAADSPGVGEGFWSEVAFEINYQIPGDANGDGYVDVSDLGILATNYGAGGGFGWAEADFTGDGFVDVSDLGILATAYGTVPSAQAVPEPSSTVLIVFCLAAWATSIRRRRRG